LSSKGYTQRSVIIRKNLSDGDTSGVSSIGKHTALTADGEGGRTVLANITVLRSRIGTADLDITASKADVTVLTPVRTPGVTNDPVLLAVGLLTVTLKNDGVVDIDVVEVVGAAVEDTRVVESPSGSSNGDDHRTVLDTIEVRVEVVGGELLVALVAEDSGHGSVGVVASTSASGGTRGVGVGALSSDTNGGGVLVSDLSSCTLATTSATTLVGVRSAGSDLLGRESHELASGQSSVRLVASSGSESPAGTALTLVLDRGGDALGAPVNGLGVILGLVDLGELRDEGGLEVAVLHGEALSVAGVHRDELLLGEVSEVVDVHVVGAVRVGVVGLDHGEVLLENRLAVLVLSRGGKEVALLVLADEVLVGVVVELVPLGAALNGGGDSRSELRPAGAQDEASACDRHHGGHKAGNQDSAAAHSREEQVSQRGKEA